MSLRFQCDKCGRLHNDHDAEAKCKHEGPREPVGQDEHGLIYDIIEERRMRRHREAQLARCTVVMREAVDVLREYVEDAADVCFSEGIGPLPYAAREAIQKLSEARAGR